MKHIGEVLKTLRKKKGWGQKELAKLVNMSTPAFSKIETGVTDLNLSRLEQFADLFEISIIELIDYGQEKQPKKHIVDLINLNNQIIKLDEEVSALQRKMIILLDELSEIDKKFKI